MMKTLLKLLTFLSAFQTILPFLKPRDRSLKTLLWLPKLFAGALMPVHALICGLGAFIGLLRKDLKLAGAGFLGLGLAAKFIEDVPESLNQFETAFGSDWDQQIPKELAPRLLPARYSLLAKAGQTAHFNQNIIIGQNPKTGKDLLADLWLPDPSGPHSGLGLIYAHGSGWRVGDKDMGTRPFFKHLTSQGHTILDIAYTLWPEANLPTMVTEINQAILWLKENSVKYGIDPDKIVLMGGSAGAHLVLLAAYAPDENTFLPPAAKFDTKVCGVIAYYPPVDLVRLQTPLAEYSKQSTPSFLEKAADSMIQTIFSLDVETQTDGTSPNTHVDIIAQILGGLPDEIPETYHLLSPIDHVGPHCPPTLLLQGTDDVFGLATGVRQLHQKLTESHVPVVYVEFPHTEHAFDLLFPQISPTAQAATYDAERFLAMLI